MEETTIIVQSTAMIPAYPVNDMRALGEAANAAANQNAWQRYHAEITDNTKLRQLNDLASYARYLEHAGINRTVEELYTDAYAWEGTTYGLLEGYKAWAVKQGYAVGTINVRLATLRKYCELAGPTYMKVISEQDLQLIQTVKGVAGKKARNLDNDRTKEGIATRKGFKKAIATTLTTSQALALKKTKTPHARGTAKRDAALMGLMIEHALRCGEIADLNIEHVNLQASTLTFYREKTDKTETHTLHKHTFMALEDYLAEEQRTSGPLFLGNKGQRLSRRAINARVNDLGKQLGLPTLSPHDLRHFWAFDALRRGTPFDKVKSGGGWKSDSMPLRYAAQAGIANEGVKISEE